MDVAVEDGASILVVDDNPLIVNVLTSLFSSEKYRVYSSCNGKEALTVLEKKEIDVIVCDVMMPELDGYGFHQVVRETPKFSHIPFVFLTALGSTEEINRGKELGADDYVVKPFHPQNLLSLVKGKVARSKNLRRLSESKYEEYRKRVIHTLSHEFRTPLVAINTGTELLLESRETLDLPKVHNLLEAIQRGGQRLERLVNDFMLLQQIEGGIAQKMFEVRALSLGFSDLLDSFLEQRREWVEQQGYLIDYSDLVDGQIVFVCEAQVLDILYRLVSNAVKFNKNDKVIEICCYPRSDEVVCEVRDRGIGIDIERIREAIDVFGQIDRHRMEQQGGGLGLAIANRYAVINGGKLEFENRSGGGSIVSLVLPLETSK